MRMLGIPSLTWYILLGDWNLSTVWKAPNVYTIMLSCNIKQSIIQTENICAYIPCHACITVDWTQLNQNNISYGLSLLPFDILGFRISKYVYYIQQCDILQSKFPMFNVIVILLLSLLPPLLLLLLLLLSALSISSLLLLYHYYYRCRCCCYYHYRHHLLLVFNSQRLHFSCNSYPQIFFLDVLLW